MSNAMATHGAVSWSELHSRETELTHNFYVSLFGWSIHDHDLQESKYTELKVRGQGFGGIVPSAENAARWLIYVTVRDVDATCMLAKAMGGRVLGSPFDTPAGRIARLVDPGGAEFFVIQYRPAG